MVTPPSLAVLQMMASRKLGETAALGFRPDMGAVPRHVLAAKQVCVLCVRACVVVAPFEPALQRCVGCCCLVGAPSTPVPRPPTRPLARPLHSPHRHRHHHIDAWNSRPVPVHALRSGGMWPHVFRLCMCVCVC